MASTNKKKFKTSATSKAAGDTVTSDAILLEPGTKDHVLVTTVDSSANLTGDVNVELEMSPDGQNWCPAQVKVTTTTQGTSLDAIVGNEKAVDLAGDTKNKFARGRLEYNMLDGLDYSGSYPLQERARKDGSDFIHHMIAVNKSFNYSGWYNSDAQPSSTYNPVLFRNAGIDDFENAKTVELTDSATQNLCEPSGTFSNGNYLSQTSANSMTFNTSDIQLTSNKKWCVSFWMKSSIFAASGSGSYGNRIFGNFGGSSAGFQIRKKSGTTDVWQLFFNGNGGTYLVADYTIPSQHNVNNTWVHVLINYSYDSVANNGAISDSIYLASMDLYINGTVCSKVDNTGYSSTTHATTLVSHGINNGTWANTPNIVEAYDELAYWDGTSLTTNQIEKVYNSGVPDNLQNTSGLTAPDHWWRHEDSSNLTYETISSTNSGSLSGATQTALTSSDSIFTAEEGVLGSIFTTTSNLSISGWFKTTTDATGTLFSNTEGAAASGMTCEVTATNIGISFKDGSPSPIVAIKDVNDGEWHHLVITKNDAGTNEFKIYVDGVLYITSTATGLTDADLKGSNGFTLLSDGQNNAYATSPTATDASKLQATLSNWSIHSEVLSANAVKQLYSNGHVRNIKNLPSVDANSIEAWWQLNDTTTPEQDLIGSNDLQYANIGITGNYMELPINTSTTVSTTNANWMLDTTQTVSPFYNSSDTSPTQNIPAPSLGIGGSFMFRCTKNGNGASFEYKDVFRINLSNNNSIALVLVYNPSSFEYRFRLMGSQPTSTSGSYTAAFYVADPYLDGEWHHFTWAMEGTRTGGYVVPATTSSGFVNDLRLYANGQLLTCINAPNSITINDSNFSGVSVTDGSLGRVAGAVTYGELSNTTGIDIDDLCYYRGPISDATASSIYNGKSNPETVSLPSGTILTSFFKGGDGANDVTTNGSEEVQSVISTNNTMKYIPGSTAVNKGDIEQVFGQTGTLSQKIIDADGATLVEDSLNGNGITLSLTKNFDFTSESWVTDSSGDAAFCLSFNGHEAQAEYFALWKCHQIKQDYNVNFLDGNWHNIVLSYRNTTEGTNVKFGPITATGVSASFNWNLSMDGIELNDQNNSIGADYIGGLNTLLVDNGNNIGFPIYSRHLKYQTTNTEEKYLAHTQGGATNIYETSTPITTDNPYGFILQPPLSTDTPWTFQGYVDETSFHSQDFWTTPGGSDPTNFEAEYSATIYGNTNGLPGTRGTGATYGVGIPYPLNDPSAIGASPGDSQYINPDRYDASTNPGGGLEAWWRWGDTDQDCGENINDVKDKEDNVSNHHIRAVSIDTLDLHVLANAPDSIYLESQDASTTPGQALTQFVDVIMTNIVDTACNVKDLAQPILQYLRVKFTGTGSVDLGEGKAKASIHYSKRRKK